MTATSQDGLRSSQTITYTVVPMPTISHVVTHRRGLITLDLNVPAPGTVAVYETAAFKSFAKAADIVHPPQRSFVFGRANLVVRSRGTVHVKLTQTQAGRLLLSWHRHAVVRLWVAYQPQGAYAAQTAGLKSLRLSR